jgi:long-chain acyl-CoA synthetase
MFDFAMKTGLRAADQGGSSALARFLLFRALKDRLGLNRLNCAATGGAALGPDNFKFFNAMGVKLLQVYGQTEMLGVYCMHTPDDIDLDTVGVPLGDEYKVRIDNPDKNGVGEIVASHPNMFLGYYKDEKATAETIVDGWMHTGDAGYFNDKGHLVVIDRIKDIATTAGGDRFSPQFIENKLKFSPYIAEAVILGNDRPHVAAIICIRLAIMSKWAEKSGIAYTTYSDLSSRSEVYDIIRREVETVNAQLPPAQRIRKFVLLYKELDADDGELTRTRKVRRGVIGEKYGDIIAAIYSDRDAVDIDAVIRFQDGSQQRIQTTLKVAQPGDSGEMLQAAE